MISNRTSHGFLAVLVLCLAALDVLAQSPTFHQTIMVGKEGQRSLQLTNDSNVPITAFLAVHFASLGLEGRDYYDVYTNTRDQVIPPGGSIIRSLSAFKGAEDKVRADVRAVVFKDGSSAGDPVWVKAVLARRLRLHDRFLSIHDLLSPLVGTGISREVVLDKLRAAQTGAEKQLPDDDLRIMDEVVFYGAISTFDVNRQASVDAVLKAYLKDSEKRVLVLEYSRPDLDAIRALPGTIPEPLSDASLPADFRAYFTRSDASSPSSGVSYCTAFAPFKDTPAPKNECTDSVGDVVTKDNNFVFSDTFEIYNAATNTTTESSWSSSAHEPPFPAYGVCWAFTDCDGTPDVYYIEGTARGQADASPTILPGNPSLTVSQGQNAEPFYWLLDNYPQPTLSDCSECDPYPAGQENPVSINAPVASTKWSFNYACVVSPP